MFFTQLHTLQLYFTVNFWGRVLKTLLCLVTDFSSPQQMFCNIQYYTFRFFFFKPKRKSCFLVLLELRCSAFKQLNIHKSHTSTYIYQNAMQPKEMLFWSRHCPHSFLSSLLLCCQNHYVFFPIKGYVRNFTSCPPPPFFFFFFSRSCSWKQRFLKDFQ